MSRPNIGDRFPIGAVGNAQKEHVLEGKTFSSEVEGVNVEGTMPNRGAVIITPGTSNKEIPAGFHNGQGYVKGDSKLVSNNIVKGISIFGVTGSAKRVVTGSFSISNYETKTINIGFKPRGVLCSLGDYYWAMAGLLQGKLQSDSRNSQFMINKIDATGFTLITTDPTGYNGTYWAFEY